MSEEMERVLEASKQAIFESNERHRQGYEHRRKGKKVPKRRTMVEVYDRENHFIKRFESIGEAVREMGIGYSVIDRSYKEKKYVCGYRFEKVEDECWV